MDNRNWNSREEFTKEVRTFVEESIIPLAERHDREENISASTIRKLGETGYLGSIISAQYNGSDMDMDRVGVLNEEMGKGCSSLRSLLTVQGMASTAIQRWGHDDMRRKWLPRLAAGTAIGAFALTEPNVGSDAARVETKAVKDVDSYIITGRKKWITMGQLADVFVVFASTDDGVTSFLVERDTPGLNVKPISGMMGLRASMLAELEFQGCRVPGENLIGSVGTGMSHVALSCLDHGRFTVAWGCIGIAQACLDSSMDYCSKRTQFGQPLRKHQLIKKMITEMIVDIKSARLLCMNAGRLKDESNPSSISETWCAKYKASKVAKACAEKAVQIHGANGYSKGYPVERLLRDSVAAEIIEGSSQIHEMIIADDAFRRWR